MGQASSEPSAHGLSSAEARERLLRDGENALPPAPPRRLYRRVASQFESALTLLLLSAAVLDLGLWVSHGSEGFPLEPLAILTVLAINVTLSVLQEYRSERAIAALRTLGQSFAWVFRDGSLARLPTGQIVREDSLRIEAGDRVPADGTVLQQSACAIDESILTGESMPLEKQANDAVSSGTLVVRGSAIVRVTATGARSTMGRLAEKLAGIETGSTPLERRISAFGRRIAGGAAVIVVSLLLLGLASEGWARLGTVVTFAIAFAVAIVPEGMPAVVTLALAVGVERMARRRAVVRRLAAVEALGSITVVATDKTGTLTENRLRVAAIFSEDEQALVEAGVLANDGDLDGKAGDPLDLALIADARSRGVDVARVRANAPRISDRPFDSAWRYSRVTVETAGTIVSYFKGAFEVLAALSAEAPAKIQRLAAMSEQQSALGRRVIAIARSKGAEEHDLELLGLVAIWDPPRKDVGKAIDSVLRAGIRVLMVTGDHPTTARAIAEQVGLHSPKVVTGEELRALSEDERSRHLSSADVIARATADDKFVIIEALQRSGAVVAMTGDGVNDAPALKRADIGVAMGKRGSDVAREVSDLVLLDDNFSTIVRAIDEGRNIYDNIQKFIRFTFATNVALSLVLLGGAFGSYFISLRDGNGALILPLTAIQVLFINFIGDGPPALALAVDRNPSAMLRPPRPFSASLLDRAAIRFIVGAGLLQGAIGLGALLFLPKFGFDVGAIQTCVFLYESGAKMVSVYPARRVAGRPSANAFLYAATAFGIALSLTCVLAPAPRAVLGLTSLPPAALLGVAISVAVTWALIELFVAIGRRFSP
jgi:P-type Ca2+ transporter type 2C